MGKVQGADPETASPADAPAVPEFASLSGHGLPKLLKGFEELKDVPSIVYGTITFDPETRRVADPSLTPTVLKDGKWVEVTE